MKGLGAVNEDERALGGETRFSAFFAFKHVWRDLSLVSKVT